jgi:hypothetical protein
MDLPHLHIYYRACSRPLIDDLEAIQKDIMDKKSNFVVIDSAGKACGGDIKDAGVVNDFFAALRQLGVTPLVIHHTAKDEATKTKTPYGSVYFLNNARSVWEVQQEQQAGDNEFVLSLNNAKVNESPREKPIGLRVTFDNEFAKTKFCLTDLRETGFAANLPLWERIRDLLLDGPQTETEIADALEEKGASVHVTLYKYKSIFTKVGKSQWGVLSNDV